MSGRILSYSFSDATAQFNATNAMSLDIGGGYTTFRSTAPLTFEAMLSDLATRAAAVVGGGPWSLTYSQTTKRVTLSRTGSFGYVLGNNLSSFLGLVSAATGAASYVGTAAPQGVLECLSLEVEPPEDASRVDLSKYRHGRVLATCWGNAQTFKCRAWITKDDVAAFNAGYVTTGRVRVYQPSGNTSPYSPTNLGGYIDGDIVATTDLRTHEQHEGLVSWAFVVAKARD